MKIKTIQMPEDLHREIMQIKLNQGERNIAQIIRELLLAYKEKKFQEHSRKFKEMLKKRKESFEDFLKDARKVREEIADEQYPD